MIGKTVSHYRILEKLGEGGMGVVYKAHDTKLDRFVALKFLPHFLTSDPTEKERFYHEARAASALVHANVAVVFEINEHDDQVFIAMEYVEGKTLKQIVAQETLTIKKVLDIAIQVCDGLAAAHERGIVHRDIKSENIMVTAKGQPKITDFGLAKVRGATKLTKEGSTLGTAAYMSPEQARGEEVDHRSDIFSFGVVLYEMLTGKLPFRGEHLAALMYSIMNDEPQPIARFNEKVTPEIERITAKALEKDREDRYQHADEMLADLRRERKKLEYVKTADVKAGYAKTGDTRTEFATAAQGETGPRVTLWQKTGEEHAGYAPPATTKARRSRKGLWYGIAAAAAVAVVCIAYLLILKHPSRVALNPDMRFRVLPIPFTEVGMPRLSRDGNWAAFPAGDANARWDVFYMNTKSGESRRVTSDSCLGMNNADISPDGSQIVYDRYNASTDKMEIAVVSTVGGSSKKIVEGGVFPRWRPDGQRIGYVRSKSFASQSGKLEFWSVKPNGADSRRELVDSLSDRAGCFAWSPDGQSICWIRHSSPQRSEAFVWELTKGKGRQVTFDEKDITDVCWASNGQLIFSSNRSGNWNLWMVPASGGSATQVTKGTGPDYSMDISSDGSKLLYYQEQPFSHIWIAGTDGSNPHQITFDDALLWRVAFSPNGKEIVCASVRALGWGTGSVVCSMDRDGRNRKELTSGEEKVNNPIPSPDGRWIVYGSYPIDATVDSSRIYLIDARNPGTPRLVGKGVPYLWGDEKTFIFIDFTLRRTCLNSIEGGESRRFFEDSTWARPLQGGKYIGYGDGRAGREGYWICAAPGTKDPELPSPKKILEFTTADYGEFDKSGRFFYYVRKAGELRRIAIPSGREEVIRGVFPGLTPTFEYSSFDISYDGKEIVYTDSRSNSRLVMVENPFR